MNGERIWGRIARLTISTPVATPDDFANVTTEVLTISVEDGKPSLRISFRVVKDIHKEPNKSKIVVTNLAPETRAKLQVKGVKVMLEVGYRNGNFFTLFKGDVRTVDHIRNGPDWDTTMQLGDGDRAYRYAQCGASFSSGALAGDVLDHISAKMGLQLGPVPDAFRDGSLSFGAGYVAEGSAQRCLDRLIKGFGYTWSIQNQTVQVLLPGASKDQSGSASIPFISPQTGLIGSPEMGSPEKRKKPALCKFKALLFECTPGGLVRIKSERYDGELLVRKVTFDGDTRALDWYTNGEGVIHG